MSSNVTNWTVSRVRQIANSLLETLAYLHVNKLTHANIKHSTVYIDKMGNWKVTDHSINTYINFLASEENYFRLPNVKGDILSVAELIESIHISCITPQMSDFIKQCNMPASVAELTEHPLLKGINRSFDDYIV